MLLQDCTENSLLVKDRNKNEFDTFTEALYNRHTSKTAHQAPVGIASAQPKTFSKRLLASTKDVVAIAETARALTSARCRPDVVQQKQQGGAIHPNHPLGHRGQLESGRPASYSPVICRFLS